MKNLNKTIRTIGIESGNQPAGIGYITIPDLDGVDRDEFVEACYRSHTVCIQGGVLYGLFYNISIDKEVLKSVIFPKKKGEMGSPVVWVNIPPWNKPVIISILKYEDEYYSNGEGELNISREKDGNNIDMSVQASKGSVNLSVITNNKTNPYLSVNLVNPNKTGVLNVYVKGKTKIHSTEEVSIISDNKISLNVLDEYSNNKVLIKYEKEKGFMFLDEFGNEIITNSELIKIKSKKINLSNGNEPMVLGNKLASLLDNLLNAIMKITVNSAGVPSTTPINILEFKIIQEQIKTIKSQFSNLD